MPFVAVNAICEWDRLFGKHSQHCLFGLESIVMVFDTTVSIKARLKRAFYWSLVDFSIIHLMNWTPLLSSNKELMLLLQRERTRKFTRFLDKTAQRQTRLN